MITQYKNIDQINSAIKSVSATRLDKSVTEFLSYSANNRFTFIPAISKQKDPSCVELHVYSGGVWQTGNHKIQLQTKLATGLLRFQLNQLQSIYMMNLIN